MTESPRLSLKAIAEQAVRAKQESQSETAQRPVVPAAAESLPQLASDAEPERLPAPPPVPRDAKPQERRASSTSLLFPAVLIAIISAALAGGVVWWLVQEATPTPSATTPATGATSAAAATSAGTTQAAVANAVDTAAVAAPTPLPTPVPSGQSVETAAGLTTARPPGTVKQQGSKSEQLSSADLGKAIVSTLGNTSGPALADTGPPLVPPAPGLHDPQEVHRLPGADPEAEPPANLTPSSGAVQAAVGSVLGNARSCVAGDREPSRARVVFDSSGAVSAVKVTGPAAGTPAEACIQTALSKARVAPFQKPNYSVDTTIRP